ncbi:hypothetical protein TeGR_g11958, partial [Tetraparma gracilis]
MSRLLLPLLLLGSTLLLLPLLSSSKPTHAPPAPSLDWDSFGFSLNGVSTDYMYLDTIKGSLASFDGAGGGAGLLRSGWSATSNPPPYRPLIVPHGPLPLLPSSTVLNYGQGLFEGLKAFRRADNTIVIFRPDKNAARCRKGCARLLMPPVPDATFVEAVSAVAAANARFVPPTGAGALYLRPLVFGSGGKLGVAASSEFTFVVWCSPVGNYFRTNGTDAGGGGGMLGEVSPITLLASKKYVRAAQGSVGGVKAIGNYA